MDKYIYDDKNGLWYELQGDYYIPCLALPTEKEKPMPVISDTREDSSFFFFAS